MMKKIVYGITFVSTFLLAYVMLGNESVQFFKWYFTLFLIGLVCLPMTVCMFRKFHDKGYIFSKVIGIALSGYLLWLFSNFKIFRFTQVNGIICVIALLIPNVFLFFTMRKKECFKRDLSRDDTIYHFLNEELIFLTLFLLWCYIKGFKAQAYGTEKFMDYGFMTSMMRAEYMPPYDLWYSGGVINYYYFGQYLAAFLSKISSVTANYGYNLMLMTIATLSTILPFSIVYNVTDYMLRKGKRNRPSLPVMAGVLSGALLSFSSNLHYLVFRFIVPALQEMLGIEVSSYWFPDATRYIGYQPETSDKTIHEFPAYSIVLGDLHAHYINIIFVLTVVGLLFAWYIKQDQIREKNLVMPSAKISFKEILNEVFTSQILMITFFIGMFHMTNFWDYPIYYVVAGAVILFSNTTKYQFSKKSILVTIYQGIAVFACSYLIALPFTLQFDQISTEIRLAVNHTPFYQLLILWGLPVCIMVGFIIVLIGRYRTEVDGKNEKKGKAWRYFKGFILQLDFTDLFILLLGLCAIGLVLMPEVIYVKDIYNGDYKRANTMFKLTYQAFILFSICSGYILVKIIAFGKTSRQRRYARIGLLLSILSIGYIGNSVNAWFKNIFLYDQRVGLDAAAFLEKDFSEDYDAITWLNDHVEGQAVVLEANGKSYSDYERVSVFTGLQTVAGWYTHEWLWRGDVAALNQRNEDIKTIYTTDDPTLLRQLVDQYDIDYIYVGKQEREAFENISNDLIKELGEVVFSRHYGGKKTTYIVKVAK